MERVTASLILRPWTSDYAVDFAHLCADPEVMRYISRGRPLSYGEASQISKRGATLWTNYGFGPWVALEKPSGRFVGRVGLNLLADWPGPNKWEVGWELVREFWGRGLATEGGRAAVEFGFEEARLGTIISVTVPDNVASRRVMERIGLTFQGSLRFRSAPEVVWYAADNPRGKL